MQQEQAASARVGDGVAGSGSSAGDAWDGHREGGLQWSFSSGKSPEHQVDP